MNTVKDALELLARAADVYPSEVKAIRYVARINRVDVSTVRGTVRLDVVEKPVAKKTAAKKTATKKD